MSLSGRIAMNFNLTHTSVLDLTTPEEVIMPSGNSFSWDVVDGTGASQADIIWHDTRTLAATTAEELDVSGGLTDAYGNTVTMVAVKMVYVLPSASVSVAWYVGGSANPVPLFENSADRAIILPGGLYFQIAPITGYPVTAATADKIKIENAGGTESTYDVVIMGTSA